MAERRGGLKLEIVSLAVIPLIALSLFLSIYLATENYRSTYDEVYNELNDLCISMHEFVQHGDMDLSQLKNAGYEKPIYAIGEETGVDITVFEGKTRIITTLLDENGEHAVGTEASDEVVIEVLENGKPYFSDDVMVNGVRYFGCYRPLENESGHAVGMTFAGKSRQNVETALIRSVASALIISWAVTMAVAILCITAASHMIKALKSAGRFMEKIAGGDTDCRLDNDLMTRNDEIGDMGRSAVKLQQSLKDLISNDPLTKLRNRRSCIMRLNEMFDAAQEGGDLTVIIGDIDFFKSFNDNYGHACGDKVLTDIAKILAAGTGEENVAARWGGEEFLLAYDTPYDSAMVALNGIMSAIRSYCCDYNGEKLNVTMTFGVQCYSGEPNIDTLVNNADKKLYHGKNSGRDRIVEELPK